jgi:hypothetical protein
VRLHISQETTVLAALCHKYGVLGRLELTDQEMIDVPWSGLEWGHNPNNHTTFFQLIPSIEEEATDELGAGGH